MIETALRRGTSLGVAGRVDRIDVDGRPRDRPRLQGPHRHAGARWAEDRQDPGRAVRARRRASSSASSRRRALPADRHRRPAPARRRPRRRPGPLRQRRRRRRRDVRRRARGERARSPPRPPPTCAPAASAPAPTAAPTTAAAPTRRSAARRGARGGGSAPRVGRGARCSARRRFTPEQRAAIADRAGRRCWPPTPARARPR